MTFKTKSVLLILAAVLLCTAGVFLSNRFVATEEISSSMMEMSNRIKQTTERASRANQVSAGANRAGREGIERMTRAMEAINSSSREIEKIIKTIDDIAFQTNLFALNAAVEGARANKYGKGFAVVADEARSQASEVEELLGRFKVHTWFQLSP